MLEKRRQFILAATVMAMSTFAARAQGIPLAVQDRSILRTGSVQYLFPEQVSIPAGKPSPVTLHFRVAQGLHINSHTPSDEFLIPTTFTIPDGVGARLIAATFPPGVIISPAFDPKTKLSVYTGKFAIQARIVATPGNHLVQGKLRYQACDQNQCLPPRTIDVPIDVIGK